MTILGKTELSGNGLNQLKLPFPWKLFKLLEESDKEGSELAQIVSWLPDGKSFKIHKPDEFCKSVMQKYFNQSKFNSFTRQLYLYGFLKIQRGGNQGAFSHPRFLKGDKHSSLSIRRETLNIDRRCSDKRSHLTSSLKNSPLMPLQNTVRRGRIDELLGHACALVSDDDFIPLPLFLTGIPQKLPFDLEPRPIEEMLQRQ